MTPPLRFFALVLGGWAAGRALLLLWPEAAPLPAVAAAVQAREAGMGEVRSSRAKSRGAGTAFPPPPIRVRRGGVPGEAFPALAPAGRPSPSLGTNGVGAVALAATGLPAAPGQGLIPRLPAPPPSASRWSVSAWAFVREGGAPALAAGGMLGGSQAGLRVGYRLSPGVTLSGRLTSPRRAAGAEAALGVEWQPLRRVPLRLAAERRQKLGSEGRSAFALAARGGVSDAPLGALRIDAYGQAGLVGARRRNAFADGALRLSLPVAEKGRLKLGVGAWGAAQPGAARLDLGPSASLRLPAGEGSVTVTLDWRLRAAGDARPGSGPALTLATDF